jgi:hypothetical protein
VLSALFFGFAAGSIWLGLEPEKFAHAWERGLMVSFLIIATVSFMLSAAWSVLLLMFAGLVRNFEFEAFIRALRWIVVLPLLLFLLGIILVAAAIGLFLWISLGVDDLPFFVVSCGLIAILMGQSLYAFMLSIRGMYDTRNGHNAMPPVHLEKEVVEAQLERFFSSVGDQRASPDRFLVFLAAQCMADTHSALAESLGEEMLPRLSYITEKRARAVFDGRVQRLLKRDGLVAPSSDGDEAD